MMNLAAYFFILTFLRVSKFILLFSFPALPLSLYLSLLFSLTLEYYVTHELFYTCVLPQKFAQVTPAFVRKTANHSRHNIFPSKFFSRKNYSHISGTYATNGSKAPPEIAKAIQVHDTKSIHPSLRLPAPKYCCRISRE